MDKEPIVLPRDATIPLMRYSNPQDKEPMTNKQAIGKVLYFVLVFGLGFWIGVSITLWITLVILSGH